MARFTRQTRRNDSKIAGMYDLEERLGAGHFAEVKLARHVFTGERVAVKVIDKLKLDDMAKHHLYQEVRCMKLVQHPNIVRLYEVIDTKSKLYLVQELGDGGDMYDYIMKHERGLSEEKARRYFRQILQAIDYCHKLYVVHRDLKPENVIFFKKFDVAKLTDFGFSNKFMPGKKLETACGSLAYSAPEILLGDSYDAPAVDVWSLGVILYMMVVGKAPFYEANESETLTMILDCKFHIPDHVSPTCKSLISRMIVRDALKRASLEDIMNDPWILQDNGPILVTTVPLANQVRLGVDQHNEVVQKMQLGDIADQETIKKCLESGSYNHVSATYYLLAEQILRRLPWHKSLSSSSLSSQGSEAKSHVPTRVIGLPSDVEQDTSTDCAVDGTSVEELPCDEPDDPDEPSIIEIDTNLLTSRLTYHSSESIYDKLKNSADEQHNEEEIIGAVSVSMTKKQRKTFQKKRVAKVKSTPAFLNQISEERESDLDDSPRASPRVRRPSRRPLDVLKAQQKNRRPSPASSSGGRRSSSVSSSSEEDGDLDKKMRRLSTERCRRSPKRRSDDEGDGDDGEGGTRSPSGVARKKKMSDHSQTRSQEASAEPGNKSDVQGKCANIHLPAAVVKDRLIEVNLKLEIHKIDSVRNESHPMDSSDLSGMNSTDFSGTIMDRSGTKECENVNLNEGTSPVRMATNDDKSDELLGDGITKDRIVRDGLVEGGIIEHGIMKDGLLKDGIVRDRLVKDGILEDGIVGDGIVRDGIVRDGIVEDLIVENAVTKSETTDDDNAENRIVDNGNLTNSGPMEDSTVQNRIVDDGILDIFQGGNNEQNTSDKENVNYSTNCATFMDFSEQDDCTQDDIPKVTFRGSDIDEIEMYMKAKDTGLELDTVAVRTIFNNRKVSQVTSNCCQII